MQGLSISYEAIALVISGDSNQICNQIAKNHGKTESSVERAMQNAINTTWNTGDTNVLLTYYTARIQSLKGNPTLIEFIYYYANKIKLMI